MGYFKTGEGGGYAEGTSDKDKAELQSIIVPTDKRRIGLGGRLFHLFCKKAKLRGATEVTGLINPGDDLNG